jgi:hypothetical protein
MAKLGSVDIVWKTVDIFAFTGMIVDQDKSSHTEVHATSVNNGTPYNNVRVSTTVTNFNHIFLKDAAGEEMDVELMNPKIGFRNGQVATLVWGKDVGAQYGKFVALYNNTSRQIHTIKKGNNEVAMLPQGFVGKAVFIVVGCVAIFMMIVGIFDFLRGNVFSALVEAAIGGGYIALLVYVGKKLSAGVAQLMQTYSPPAV